MHSPVWQEHPSDDIADYWSDWSYYTDDYYDQGSPKRKRQKIAGGAITEVKDKAIEGAQVGKRRGRFRPAEDVPELSLGESLDSDMEDSVVAKPTIVWRLKEAHDPIENLVVTEGEGEKVALLGDWRERFKASTKQGRNTAVTKGTKTQKLNQRAVAVVIGPRPSELTNGGIDALKISSKAKNMPSRIKAAPRHANGAPISKPSTAKAKAPISSTTDGIKPPATSKKSLHGIAMLGQRANEVETIVKKRTRPGAEEEATTDGDETIPVKRRAPTTKKKENGAVQAAAHPDAYKTGSKRKAPDEDDETITPQAVKRKAPAPKVTTATSEPKKGSTVPIRRNTRSKRV